jgi:hypothetical protein
MPVDFHLTTIFLSLARFILGKESSSDQTNLNIQHLVGLLGWGISLTQSIYLHMGTRGSFPGGKVARA